jgi:hypothetical protein
MIGTSGVTIIIVVGIAIVLSGLHSILRTRHQFILH